MSKRILVMLGTRPEAIKLAPVIKALRERPENFEVLVCSSGQHREMLDQALAAFNLVPDVNLSVMRNDQTLPELTATLITQITSRIREVKPDWVIVQGDTSTAFASALSAYYQRVRIAHVEAGLRSHDRYNPFPEEINRQMIGALADLHFAPTQRAVDALLREGITPQRIFLTGNTVVDSLNDLKLRLQTEEGLQLISPPIQEIVSGASTFVLITCHRRESFGVGLSAICRAIERLAKSHPNVLFIFPVHLNPNVRAQVLPMLEQIGNVRLLEPFGYIDFIYLLSRSHLVLSDSGGIQEEAPSFGVPVLVLRNTTERREGIDAGFAELVGTDEALIVSRAASILLQGKASWANKINPYGNGVASKRIADVIAKC
jgi:UDP-N-acetylglucosamine 2-epimerase (non-hydrolysing)